MDTLDSVQSSDGPKNCVHVCKYVLLRERKIKKMSCKSVFLSETADFTLINWISLGFQQSPHFL